VSQSKTAGRFKKPDRNDPSQENVRRSCLGDAGAVYDESRPKPASKRIYDADASAPFPPGAGRSGIYEQARAAP
jgi:hypothetical protein